MYPFLLYIVIETGKEEGKSSDLHVCSILGTVHSLTYNLFSIDTLNPRQASNPIIIQEVEWEKLQPCAAVASF